MAKTERYYFKDVARDPGGEHFIRFCTALFELEKPEDERHNHGLSQQFINTPSTMVDEVKDRLGIEWRQISKWIIRLPSHRRKCFDFSNLFHDAKNAGSVEEATRAAAPLVALAGNSETLEGDLAPVLMHGMRSIQQLKPYVPAKDPKYVAWGDNSDMVASVILSRQFFPLYIQGPSGNGKTKMVEQACAKTGREYVRIQINPETDEDDLLGGLRLIDDETVFVEGPVTCAMRSGAILLIDEIDRGTNKIMCLQGIMEGSPVLVKKTGETVVPAPGFNVIATANTLGRGSDDGKYIAASIIDDAFLERFPVTLDQPFAPEKQERLILLNHAKAAGLAGFKFMDQVVDVLLNWARGSRATMESGGMNDQISTRRLCHIVNAMQFFGNAAPNEVDKLAVQLCLNRYDKETREAFMQSYMAVRPHQYVDKNASAQTSAPQVDESLSEQLDKMMQSKRK